MDKKVINSLIYSANIDWVPTLFWIPRNKDKYKKMFITQSDDRYVNMRDILLHDKCNKQVLSGMQETAEYKESLSFSGGIGNRM